MSEVHSEEYGIDHNFTVYFLKLHQINVKTLFPTLYSIYILLAFAINLQLGD
jgi:hypothetical protein